MLLRRVADRVCILGSSFIFLVHANVLALVGEVLQVTEEVWRELLVDLQEHILQIRHRDTVGADIVLIEALVEHLKEAAKILRLRLWNDVRDLLVDLTGLLNALEVRLEELFEAWVGSSSLLDECNLVADTETVLEEKRAAEALHRAFAHDANTVAKHVCFVHVMSSENDDSVLLV